MHIVSIVGARPNFVKIAPISWQIEKREGVRHTLVHSGQHYDADLSNSFFQHLSIKQPDINLNVGSGAHGAQTGRIMIELEPVLAELRPDWALVVGDVNSTAAASIVAKKLNLKLAHVEAGLRSFDREMPEEINRLVTDAISDLLLITEGSADENLRREGVPAEKVVFTGNVMIDSLVKVLPAARELAMWDSLGFEGGDYLLVTLHRPSNVDTREQLTGLTDVLAGLSDRLPVVFPVHPRTRNRLEQFGVRDYYAGRAGLHLHEPFSYLQFLSLMSRAKGLITDSGGVQEETTYLGVPCITLRPNTERPVTITTGTNELIEPAPGPLREAALRLLDGNWKSGQVPPLWDGHAAERIVDALLIR